MTSSTISHSNSPASEHDQVHLARVDSTAPNERNWAFIAFGSNLGDRIANIESALTLMKERGLEVTNLSRIYETKPMYYEDQAAFLNGACRIQTNLEPLPLLDILQGIENDLGRKRLIDKGPRTIDLDIILFNNHCIQNERLEVPHKLLKEREFVLRPLHDLAPAHRIPPHGQTVGTLLNQLEHKDASMSAVTILAPQLPLIREHDPTRKTHIMAILNVTPDSFSDGGQNTTKDILSIKSTVKEFIQAGATIIDVGGQSTRPRADLLTPEDELDRVLPVVRAIREMPEADDIAISVDTFYADVARKTVLAGADIVNDVSAGLLDEQMLPTVAKLGKTMILMHMRGNPHTMMGMTNYETGVVQGVRSELNGRLKAAMTAGIPPWRIILDPGLGFAKTQDQNLTLLRELPRLRNFHGNFRGIPWLVGPSRKGFVGKITGIDKASQRTWGTAAAVTASIAGGAEIVRVHDVAEMGQVAKMADAIYRRAVDYND